MPGLLARARGLRAGEGALTNARHYYYLQEFVEGKNREAYQPMILPGLIIRAVLGLS